jgi:periplasmic divalent cation tolerance protein
MPKYYLAYTTTSSHEEAKKIATALVNKKIVACVNIIPSIESIYWWEGKVMEDNECLLLMKTHEQKIGALLKTVPELHSYSCPELIVTPIEKGLPAYLQWLESSTAD